MFDNLQEKMDRVFKTLLAEVDGALSVGIVPVAAQLDLKALAAALRAHGVGICLDDFGTGYSSLGYLRQLGFDRLKIDRSFVQRMLESHADEAIVRGIVALAEALDLTLTAEGVETAGQFAALRSLGWIDAQGFHFARPMPADELGAWVKAAG